MSPFTKSAYTRTAMGLFLLGTTSTVLADAYDVLMESFPTPEDIALAKQRLAETNIEKPWQKGCPYQELTSSSEAEDDEYFFRCQRWNDCSYVSQSASIYSEAFFQNHQRKPEQQMPWEYFKDGSMFGLETADFESLTGHIRRYALESAEENWRLFEGRDAAEASDLVEQKFWQWCAAEPLSLWEAEYQ
ncbi:hypothetical protein [Pseudidiomarina sediminum]|uniref:hypothetical protein n=1 Tax=Pseudidiomarina sediminum TaxID=431675 RepID=UPI001C93E397|nr:hypothetical protein [Pseudidiomarina sediminum]MBY6064235.1 hypothetical protein [Pseudidiomarina sediminum]